MLTTAVAQSRIDQSPEQLSDVLYDRIYSERQDVSFYVDAVTRYEGPVLEAACGTGRVLIPSLRAGAEVVGFDICQPRLAICRQKIESEPPEVRGRATVRSGDMRTADFGSDFGLVTIPFRGFQDLVTVEDERAALLNMRRHLRPGGRLVLDVFNPSIPFLADPSVTEEFMDSTVVIPGDEVKISLAYRVVSRDYWQQLQHVEEIIYVERPDEPRVRQARRFTTRYLFRQELEYLLNLTGFEVEHVYGSFDKQPFGESYPGELIVVARKAERPFAVGAR
jgi:SAM-dependent methyltransferase